MLAIINASLIFSCVLVIFKEDSEEMVSSKDWMVGKANQENFVHCHGLLECCQILAEK
jgi:hypothetical protein